MNRFLSLKARIFLIFGGLVTIIMAAVSVTILFEWRQLILKDQIQNAYAVTQSFSFSVIDALIENESSSHDRYEYLEDFILNFARKNKEIKYVALYDDRNHLRAHSDLTALAREQLHILLVPSYGVRVYPDERYGWIIRCDYPLTIAGKHWGSLRIGFDAAPTRQAIRKLFLLLLILTLISLALILTVIYLFTRRLTYSLTRLVKEMDRVELDSASFEPLPTGNDETGLLAGHFNAMRERLIKSQQDLLEAQRQLLRAEKLASIGRLASGVAHEVNNPLNGIKNCLYTIRKEPANRQLTEKYMALMEEGLAHIETVVRKLLTFSRQSSRHPSHININEEIRLVLSLLAYRLEQKRISIQTELNEQLPPVFADGQLIQEVLMNLLINSYDAVAEQGRVIIRSGRQGDDRVFVSIIDDGPGIPPELIEKIFDPFFTTKGEGEGTGLGLSVSLGIVEAHDGELTVSSRPGETVFTIILPIAANEERHENSAD